MSGHGMSFLLHPPTNLLSVPNYPPVRTKHTANDMDEHRHRLCDRDPSVPGVLFSASHHSLMDGNDDPESGSVVAETAFAAVGVYGMGALFFSPFMVWRKIVSLAGVGRGSSLLSSADQPQSCFTDPKPIQLNLTNRNSERHVGCCQL